jgi:hypothetical protein
VLSGAQAADMTVHGTVVRRIGEDHLREFTVEETGIRLRVAGVAAHRAVLVHQPHIADPAHSDIGDIRHRISWVILDGRRCASIQNEIDFSCLEAGQLGQINVDFRQIGEFKFQDLLIPAGQLR